VVSLSVGQVLSVVNDDQTLHNIHGRPKSNATFNFSQPSKGMVREVRFATAELPIPVKCDVHGWMNAYLGVFAHPFHKVTGADGAFSLVGLPAGHFEISCWHPKLGVIAKEVTLGAGAAIALDFAYSAARP
jgi:hypothetical protein